MKKNNQSVPTDKKKRPMWLNVIGFVSAPLLVLSVFGICFALLGGSEEIVKNILAIFLALFGVLSVVGILFALRHNKKNSEDE